MVQALHKMNDHMSFDVLHTFKAAFWATLFRPNEIIKSFLPQALWALDVIMNTADKQGELGSNNLKFFNISYKILSYGLGHLLTCNHIFHSINL